MKSKRIFKFLSFFAATLFVIAAVTYFYSTQTAQHLIVAALIVMAIAFQGHKNLKGFTYSVFIIVGICLGMFFPHSFTEWGDFKLDRLIVPFVQVTMLGMGAQMSFDDFKGVIKMPKGVVTGVICQFTVMPLVAFILSRVFNFPPEIAAGVVLIGVVPSAMASNVMSFLAKANLALAVTIGATATLLAPFITPMLMRWLGGQYIEVNVISMMLDITNMIIVPIIAGFIFNLYYRENSLRSKQAQMSVFALIIIVVNLILHFSTHANISVTLIQVAKSFLFFYFLPFIVALILKNSKRITYPMISSALGFVAMLGIVINTTIVTAAGRDSLMQVGILLILSCLIHNVVGYTVGYSAAKLMKLPVKDRRTIAFEVGMQNGGVATGLALEMGKIATVGLASAIFGPLQNLTGSALVQIFKRQPINTVTTSTQD
jgi:BASS family bile acid:Na+ symporter